MTFESYQQTDFFLFQDLSHSTRLVVPTIYYQTKYQPSSPTDQQTNMNKKNGLRIIGKIQGVNLILGFSKNFQRIF